MRSIAIISEFPLHRDALKATVKEVTPFKVFVYADLARGIRRAIRLAPALVLIDNPDIRPRDFEPFFEHTDRCIKVVAIDWERNKMVVYSRTAVLEATLENLSEVTKSTKGNDAQKTHDVENARLHKRPTNK